MDKNFFKNWGRGMEPKPEIRQDPFSYKSFPQNEEEREFLQKKEKELIDKVSNRLPKDKYIHYDNPGSYILYLFDNMTNDEKELANQLSRLLRQAPLFTRDANGVVVKKNDFVSVKMPTGKLDRGYRILRLSSYIPDLSGGKDPSIPHLPNQYAPATFSEGINDLITMAMPEKRSDSVLDSVHPSVVVFELREVPKQT